MFRVHVTLFVCVVAVIGTVIARSRAAAQVIRGQVIDAEFRTPISLATLTVLTGTGSVAVRTLSDSSGRFAFSTKPGRYQVRAERIGYLPVTDTITVADDMFLSVTLAMSTRAVPLKPLVVNARSALERGRYGFERRQKFGKGVFLTADSIAARKPTVATDAFYAIPGVMVSHPAWAQDPVIYPLTGSKCLLIYLNHLGLPVAVGGAAEVLRAASPRRRPGLAGTGLLGAPRFGIVGGGLNTRVGVESIQGIEIYRNYSEMPEELRTGIRSSDLNNATHREPCGIALVWTREAW
jgi:hypothetical protein